MTGNQGGNRTEDQIFELSFDMGAGKFRKLLKDAALETPNAKFGITPAKMDDIVFWC